MADTHNGVKFCLQNIIKNTEIRKKYFIRYQTLHVVLSYLEENIFKDQCNNE